MERLLLNIIERAVRENPKGIKCRNPMRQFVNGRRQKIINYERLILLIALLQDRAYQMLLKLYYTNQRHSHYPKAD